MKTNILQDKNIDKKAVADLRSLVVGSRIPIGASSPRVGQVILNARPVIRIRNSNLVDANETPFTSPANALEEPFLSRIDNIAIAAMAEIASNFSSSVGRIDVRTKSGDWVSVGTGFLTSTGTDTPPRFITAGHVAAYFLAPDHSGPLVRALYPPSHLTHSTALNDIRVVFHDKPDELTQGVRLTEIIWPHSRWDLAVCQLESSANFSALPIETSPSWAIQADEPIAVLGYPIDESILPNDNTHETIAGLVIDQMYTKCLSPGLSTNATEPIGALTINTSVTDADLRHDATTLGGNSGSPVISLRTQKVVGLHYAGGSFVPGGVSNEQGVFGRDHIHDFANRSVHLPFIMAETRLKQEVLNIGEIENREDSIFAIGNSPWTKQGVEENAELETVHHVVRNKENDLPTSLLESAFADRPDDRDKEYKPNLRPVPSQHLPARDPDRPILNQRTAPACTAFALAAAINQQAKVLDPTSALVSPRMLFEMGQAHDEWIDDSSQGSSLRGALKGFDRSGVCTHNTAPFFPSNRPWFLNRAAAREAHDVQMGSYLRVAQRVNDYHIALLEIGCILVSAKIHSGWIRPSNRRIGRIQYSTKKKGIGQHAFVIVGYDSDGFIVQNSWGSDWSVWNNQPGLAHWSYEDWNKNVLDAWVFHLKAKTSEKIKLLQSFSSSAIEDKHTPIEKQLPRPDKYSLLGHLVQVEHDYIVENGRLGLGTTSLMEAVCEIGDDKAFKHVALLYLDPFLNLEDSYRFAGYTTPVFLANGIIPLHIVFGHDELQTIFARINRDVQTIAKRFRNDPEGARRYLERRSMYLIQPVISRFIESAKTSINQGGSLWRATAPYLEDAVRNRKLHQIAFGCGSLVADVHGEGLMRASVTPVSQWIRFGGVASPDFLAEEKPLEFTEICLCKLEHTQMSEWMQNFLPSLVSKSLGSKTAPYKHCNYAKQKIQSKCSGLQNAMLESRCMNEVLASILGRKPAKTRCF